MLLFNLERNVHLWSVQLNCARDLYSYNITRMAIFLFL